MPRVEKTTGGRLRTRVADQEFVAGETYEVDAETAEYLVDELGDFEIVDADAVDAGESEAETPALEDLDGAEGSLPFNPTNFSVDELEERIADIADTDVLIGLRNVEKQEQDDPRTTAVDALNDRINDLEG